MMCLKMIGFLVTCSVLANGSPISLGCECDDVYALEKLDPAAATYLCPPKMKIRRSRTELANSINYISLNTFAADQQAEYDEMGEFFEGDMVLTRDQQQTIYNATESRNGLVNASNRWPERTVVYHIVKEDFDEEEVKLIEKGMADIANKSCIHFRAQKDEKEHAVIIQGSKSGCFSNVGITVPDDDEDKPQVLNLAKGCFKHGTVVHEMLHTLGFYHMQSTYDRDNFVKIVWENVQEGKEHNFAKYTNNTVTDFGVPYDYGSVMHYSAKAFTKNGNQTIVPLKANVTVGQRDGMSESDIIKLNKMYCEN